MSTWRRLGRIFHVSGQAAWMQTHASLPTPLHLQDDRYRIFFATRDAQNRSHIGHFDIDLAEPREILDVARHPHLAPGPLGHFDDHGVYPSAALRTPHGVRLYYIGWTPGVRRPLFYAAIGAAEAPSPAGPFQRVSPAPLVQRGPHDPWMVTSPCVVRAGDRWRMWYVSGLRMEEQGDGLASYYHIKDATSHDGIDWDRQGHVAIGLRPGESNIARPAVVQDRDGWRMWYARSDGSGYRLGYATSGDGHDWIRRDDELTFTGPAGEWEREAAYPAVFDHDGARYMLYNGNGYGREGIGLAILEDRS